MSPGENFVLRGFEWPAVCGALDSGKTFSRQRNEILSYFLRTPASLRRFGVKRGEFKLVKVDYYAYPLTIPASVTIIWIALSISVLCLPKGSLALENELWGEESTEVDN